VPMARILALFLAVFLVLPPAPPFIPPFSLAGVIMPVPSPPPLLLDLASFKPAQRSAFASARAGATEDSVTQSQS